MKRMGNGFDAFEGAGVVIAVRNDWAKANADMVVSFLRAAAKAQRFLYDPANKERAVDIMVKYTHSPREDMAKSYDSFYGTDKIMSPTLEITERGLQSWLDLRGSNEKPGRYIDASYWKRAAGR
jgi:ABC-type nitrate/sulfonate/bicarbonate transport system substrate-binding protein